MLARGREPARQEQESRQQEGSHWAFLTETVFPSAAVSVRAAGLEPNAGQRAAEALIAGGATHLMSFGLAGGLNPAVSAGAVVIPADAVRKLPAAIDLVSRREKVILDVCRAPDFTPARLREALKRSGEIHCSTGMAWAAAFTGGDSISRWANTANPLYTETVRNARRHAGDQTDNRHPSSAGC